MQSLYYLETSPFRKAGLSFVTTYLIFMFFGGSGLGNCGDVSYCLSAFSK